MFQHFYIFLLSLSVFGLASMEYDSNEAEDVSNVLSLASELGSISFIMVVVMRVGSNSAGP